jgi:sec-independent protein translocase protein TatB
MFGMGGSEIIVILIIALIFLGPDKLPEATKAISKGIRDLKKGSRTLQQTIENDEHIGGAIRDLKSALRGEEPVVRPKPLKRKKPAELTEGEAPANSIGGDGPATEHVNGVEPAVDATTADTTAIEADASKAGASTVDASTKADASDVTKADATKADASAAKAQDDNEREARAPLVAEAPKLRLPDVAGEAEPVEDEAKAAGEELAAMIRPAEGTIAKGSEPKHG